MAIGVQSSSASNKLVPLKSWYLLFPENWTESAFDREWRSQRLKILNEQAKNFDMFYPVLVYVWIVGVGAVSIMSILQIIMPAAKLPEMFSRTDEPTNNWLDFSSIVLVIYFAWSTLGLIVSRLERTLLQIIDRIECQDTPHV